MIVFPSCYFKRSKWALLLYPCILFTKINRVISSNWRKKFWYTQNNLIFFFEQILVKCSLNCHFHSWVSINDLRRHEIRRIRGMQQIKFTSGEWNVWQTSKTQNFSCPYLHIGDLSWQKNQIFNPNIEFFFGVSQVGLGTLIENFDFFMHRWLLNVFKICPKLISHKDLKNR